MKTLKPYARPLLLAAFCLLAAPGLCPAQGREAPPPKFEGSSLPEPPRQREPWTPPQTKLSEALVAELEEVAARQWGQPGGVSLGEDPRVRALVARGEEAVEPLLRALETDERLTRSVSFCRSFHPGRDLITVAETAYSALTRILKTNAFGGHAEWVGALTPAEAGEHLAYLFTPMWRYAEHPAVAAAAARMFDAAGSPWLPLIDGEDRQSFHRAELLGTPMLNVKSFRERALEGLADRTVVGTLRPRRAGRGDRYDLTVENTYAAVLTGSANSSEAAFQVTAEDARAPRALESMSVRVCDVYASRLARLSGAPRLQVYWAEAERDRAVSEMAAFLRNHNGRFTTSSGTY